jgi:glycosyltransferase involved in cell wall biosynthesis
MTTEIIALSVCKNEDLWIRHAVENVLNFADRVTVLDNGSTDGTMDILRGFGSEIELHQEHDLRAVHGRFIEPHAGKNVWMFGFDGDEVYDADGVSLEQQTENIRRMREYIASLPEHNRGN